MRWSKIQTQLPGLLEGCQQVPDGTGNGRGGEGGARNKGDGAICGVTHPPNTPLQAAARHFMGLVQKTKIMASGPISSVQFSSVAQSCPTLCNPMNRSTPGLPVQHQLPEFTQTHIHRVSDAIQPSHPLSSPFPPAPNPSQHQSLFQ